MTHFSSKSPAETIDIGFDFSNLVLNDLMISSASIDVTTETGIAAANTLTKVGSPSIVGKTILQRLSAGVVDNTYKLTATITASNGEIFSEANCIAVEEKAC
jgi:hypothetical protein